MKHLSNKTKIYFVICALSSLIFLIYAETNEEEIRKIIDPILLVMAIGYVIFWVLDKFLSSGSKKEKIKKKKNRISNQKKELSVIQYIIFYPFTVLGFMVLIGLVKSCGKV